MVKSCMSKEGEGRKTRTLFHILLILLIIPLSVESATYTVTRVAPDDNNLGSLRRCMNDANGNPGADTIVFNIPGGGPHIIMPDSQLPILIDQAGVLIDGFSQAGASAGANPPATANLVIVIDGTNAGAVHGIWIWSSNNIVQGLVVNHFQQDGIRIEARFDTTQFNYIYCNFVGTDWTGNVMMGNGWNAQGLWAGIDIICTPTNFGYAYNNTIDRNLSSGNYAEGIAISSCPPGDVAFNSVLSNYVGTDVAGMFDFGNVHDGVVIAEGAHDNVVDGNLISGNDFEGVCIIGYAEAIPPVFTYANIVANNIIGLDVSLNPLPNTRDGVSIGIYGTWYQGGYATDNVVITNTIAHNGRNGVLVWEHHSSIANADHNEITQNSIYNNILLGIDLGDNGVTVNDPGDIDVGANEEVNFPVITSAVYSGGQTTITGTVNLNTNPSAARVEIFGASTDPSGYGEGQVFVNSAVPNVSGNWTVVTTGINAGDTITATTTDINTNTSEFCQNFIVVTGIEENMITAIAQTYGITQTRPNPFTHTTLINYALPAESEVGLHIYDISGRLVRTLVDKVHASGSYTAQWDGIDARGRRASPGVYMCVFRAGAFTDLKRIVRVD